MFFGNRLVKTIVLILGVFLLVINVVIWANDTDVVSKNYFEQVSEISNFSWWSYDEYNSQAAPQNYYGFRFFFDKLSTFPGLRATWTMLKEFGDVINNFSVTSIPLLDVLFAIFRVLFTPVMLLITIVTDIYSNVKWFIEFIVFSGSPVKLN